MLIRDGDDSSDDEEDRVVPSSEITFGNIASTSDENLSMISHMIGLELLHSSSVNKIYYSNKSRILNDCRLLTPESEIEEKVGQTLIDFAESVFKDFYGEFESENIKLIREVIDGILSNKRFIYKKEHREKYKDSFQFKKIEPILFRFYEAIRNFAGKCDQTKDVEQVNCFSAIDLTNKQTIKHVYTQEDKDRIRETLHNKQIVDEKGYIIKYSQAQKPTKQQRENKQKYDHASGLTIIEQIVKDEAKLRNTTHIDNISDSVKTKIAQEKIAEELITESNNPESPLREVVIRESKSSDSKQRKYALVDSTKEPISPLLQQVIKKSPKKLFEKTTILINRYIVIQNLMKIDKTDLYERFYCGFKKQFTLRWERSVLSEQFTLVIKNSNELLAGIRLLNKSQTRLIRQKEQDGDIDFQEIVARGFSFSVGELTAFETQEVTEGNKRSDYFPNFDSYAKIWMKLEKLQKASNDFLKQYKRELITDKHLAKAIRRILNGDKDPLQYDDGKKITLDKNQENPLLKFLVNLTFFLFVTEGARNPASLITTQMVLDLIIQGETWKKALADPDLNGNGGWLPMSMLLAVQSARCLHKEFHRWIPYHYKYEGDEGKKDDGVTQILIKREAFVLRSWAKLQNLDIDTLVEKKSLETLIRAIKEKMRDEWYHSANEPVNRIKIFAQHFFNTEDLIC